MSTFRLAALGILAVLAAVYGYYLFGQTRPAETPKEHAIIAEVLSDGAVSIEGAHFDNPVKLKAKIADIRKKYPGAKIHVRASKDIPFETIGKAFKLFESAGVPLSVGFITEPRKVD